MKSPTRCHNLAQARRQFGALADRYCAALTVGDPLADVAAAQLSVVPRRQADAWLTRALDFGPIAIPDAPPGLRALFTSLDRAPAWVDWARVRRGARVYQRLGLSRIAILVSLSLMRGYHSSAVNKPLTFTTKLDAMARQRLGATGQYIHQVCQSGGLRRCAPGFKATVKVRLLHAHIRRMLLASPRWQRDAWGVPLNQADLCTTGLAFSYAVVVGARKLGFRLSDRDVADVLHLWRYASAVMGVDPDLLWDGESDARRLSELVDLVQPGADQWSHKLAQALRDVPVQVVADQPWLPGWVGSMWQRYLDGLTRALNGDPLADELGIPRTRWATLALPLSRAAIAPIELARHIVPGASRAMSAVGNRMFASAVALTLGQHRATHARPDRLPGARRVATRAASVTPLRRGDRFAGAIYDDRPKPRPVRDAGDPLRLSPRSAPPAARPPRSSRCTR